MSVADPLSLLADLIAPPANPWADDPVGWVENRAGEVITDKQAEILRSVVDNRLTAVHSCNSAGKSRSASWLVGWWLDSHPVGETFVVTSAPTSAQISAVLWRYIGQMHRKLGMFGYITGDNQWKLEHGGSAPQLVAYGRKPADADPGGFSGIHDKYVLVVLDEAGGIPESLYHAASSLISNKNGRMLAIGNPDDPSSHFRKICQPESSWNVIHIDGLRSPNMTRSALVDYPDVRRLMIEEGIAPAVGEPPAVIRDGLADPRWVSEQIREMGVNSPVFMSKVRGLFPTVTNDTLISPHMIELAKTRETDPIPSLARLGVDVARYGVDHTIIVSRQGAHARVVLDLPQSSTRDVADAVQTYGQPFIERGGPLPIACVDDAGVGGGVVDELLYRQYPTIPIVHQQGSVQRLGNGKARFYNTRSELLWNLREAFVGPSGTGEDGWIDIDPEDTVLHSQLTSMKYRINEHGQIVVESKADMKNRGLPSPDRADALSYSMAPDEIEQHVKMDQTITGALLTKAW